MASKSTPGYLIVLADMMNLGLEMGVYAASFVVPAYLIWSLGTGHPLAFVATLVVGWLLAAVTFVVVLIAIRRLVGKVPNGRLLLTSSRSYKWMFAERLTKMMMRSPFAGLVTENALFRFLFYRGMGAKFDFTFMLGPGALITEPWSFSAGKNVIVGAHAAVSGHKVEGKVVTLGRVDIGNDVLIGTRALVLPNVKIGNRVVVGANSVVLQGSVIPDGETWAGNPACKIDPVKLAQIRSASMARPVRTEARTVPAKAPSPARRKAHASRAFATGADR